MRAPLLPRPRSTPRATQLALPSPVPPAAISPPVARAATTAAPAAVVIRAAVAVIGRRRAGAAPNPGVGTGLLHRQRPPGTAILPGQPRCSSSHGAHQRGEAQGSSAPSLQPKPTPRSLPPSSPALALRPLLHLLSSKAAGIRPT